MGYSTTEVGDLVANFVLDPKLDSGLD